MLQPYLIKQSLTPGPPMEEDVIDEIFEETLVGEEIRDELGVYQ